MPKYKLTVVTTIRETYEVVADSQDHVEREWDNGNVTMPVMTDTLDAELESVTRIEDI